MTEVEPLTPNCPACGQPPSMMLPGGAQAFCVDPGCPVMTWNPLKSPEDIIRGIAVIDLGDLEPGPPFCEGCGHFHDPDSPHLASPCPDRRCCIQPPGL